jgi:hypothetical protein
MEDDLSLGLQRLRDPVGLVRKGAARDLGALGDARALDSLVVALADADGEVREEAARALGRLGDRRALQPLEALYLDERPAVRRAAQDAVGAIARAKKPRGAAPGKARQPSARERLLEEALVGTGATWDTTPFGYEVDVPLGRRKQRVRVIFENPDPDGDPAILVQTNCGPAHENNFKWALKLNLKLAYGHLAVRRVENEDQFVFCQTLLEPTTQPVELRKAVLAAAEKGDWVEKQVTGGKDEN